jgi:hypothetical protein
MFSALMLSIVPLIACGGDPVGGGDGRQTAAFAAMTEDQRTNEMDFATTDLAQLIADKVVELELMNRAMPDCPAREDGSGVVSFSAEDCVRPDGTVMSGKLVAHNVPMFDDRYGDELTVDRTQPMVIEMQGLRTGDFTYDGVVEQSTPAARDGERYSWRAEYELGSPSTTTVISYDSECTRRGLYRGRCTVDGFIDRGDVGGYAVAGEFEAASVGALGSVELRGIDTVRVDFAALVDGCAPYTIDGEPAGRFCP